MNSRDLTLLQLAAGFGVILFALACSSDAGSPSVDVFDTSSDGSGDSDTTETDAGEDADEDAGTDPMDDPVDDPEPEVTMDVGDPDGSGEDAGMDVVEDTMMDVVEDTGGPPDVPSPYDAGPYDVITGEEEITISEGFFGGDSIVVDIYLPSSGADAPYPVVMFSHGFQLNPGQYESYGNRLASHGFVALLPHFDDGITSPYTHVELADFMGLLLDWVDTSAETPGSILFGSADTSRVGAGGHSRGGKTSLLAAADDDRIIASFNVDPVDSEPPGFTDPADYPSVTPERMGDITIPTAYVGGSRSSGGVVGTSCAPEEENHHQYFINANSPAYEYFIDEMGHLDFADGCGLICATCPSGDNEDFGRDFTRATMTAFYHVYLHDNAQYRYWVDGPGVTLQDLVTFDER